MNAKLVLTLAVASSLTALADFSYSSTTKSSGAMGGMANNSTKHYFKGTKMKTETATVSTITDFGAETITTINNAGKSYTVLKFSDIAAGMKDTGVLGDVKVDIRETGQKKDINGFASREYVLTVDTGMGVMDMNIWISSAVPGAGELKAFYARNGAKLHLMAGAGGAGANPSMAKAMTELQKKMYSLDGVQVLQVMKLKMGGGQDPQMAKAMADMQKQLEQIRKSNPEQAKMMEKAMGGRMGGGGGGPMIETTTESTGFSTASVPDSVFAIPAGYSQKSR